MEQLETIIKEAHKKSESMLKESKEVQKKIKEQIQEKIKNSVLQIKGTLKKLTSDVHMKIQILKKELINYESEFEFFSKVIDNYEKEFDNLRNAHGKNVEHPSETIFKIVQLLQHKTERTTRIFNDMLIICQKETSYDQGKQNEENNMLFTEILEEFAHYFDSVTRKTKNLKARIHDLKQKAFGTGDSRMNRNTFDNSLKIEKDKVFNYSDNLDKKRGFKNLEGILVNYGS